MTTLADIIAAHQPRGFGYCTCNATMCGGYPAHLQDAILAAFPAIADMLPEVDCMDYGEWKPKDRVQPTVPDGFVCHDCLDSHGVGA